MSTYFRTYHIWSQIDTLLDKVTLLRRSLTLTHMTILHKIKLYLSSGVVTLSVTIAGTHTKFEILNLKLKEKDFILDKRIVKANITLHYIYIHKYYKTLGICIATYLILLTISGYYG